jgi:coiled-coil domain-containing protein 63/114
LKNKEKVKIMDQYMRNMIIIDDCFNQIKEITGITDIHEIQNTFIKSEEQNYALLTYVDLLH